MPSNIMRKPRISSASRRFFNPSIRLQAQAVQNLNSMEKTQQDIEYEWFTENYAEISRKHPRRFVVIKDMEVVGSAPTFAAAVDLGKLYWPLGEFIVQYCDGGQEVPVAEVWNLILAQNLDARRNRDKDGNFRKCSLYTNDTPGYATGTTWPGQEPEHLKKEPSIGRTDR